MYDKLYFGSPGSYKQFARDMRKNMTEAEAILWKILRGRKLKGYKFRRQHAIGDYIVDFYCVEKALIVEADGEIHMTKEQNDYDAARTVCLQELGLKELRFNNDEIFNNLESVIKKIKNELI